MVKKQIPTYEIVCVKQDKLNDPYTSITDIGYREYPNTASALGKKGKPTWIPQKEAISQIQSQKAKFIMSQGRETLEVINATNPIGVAYLKTADDHDGKNKLLSLPECQC